MKKNVFTHFSLRSAGVSGIWGVIAIGIFADNPAPLDTTSGRKGLIKGANHGLFDD